MKYWNNLSRYEKIALIFGVLIGWVVTRTFEDGNLLVTIVVTIFCANVALITWKIIYFLAKYFRFH